jgi:hypothetical protein
MAAAHGLHGEAGTMTAAMIDSREFINARKVSHVVFKPDWTRHQKATPFKRNAPCSSVQADEEPPFGHLEK